MKKNYRILAGRVLLLPDEVKEEKTATGIFLPQTAIKEPNRGKAVVVGNCIPNEIHDIAVGDIVLYRDNAGQEVVLDGVKYRLVMVKETLTHYTE